MIPSTTFAIEPADYDGTGAPIIVDISDEVFPIRISVEGDVTITGTGKPQLECRPGTQLTLDNVTIDFSAEGDWYPIQFEGAGNTLTLVGTNTLNGGNNVPAILLYFGTTELEINGEGTLIAKGGLLGAGIGGNSSGVEAGDLTITGGTIVASGGPDSPGIGGSGVLGDITISGGKVFANGGANGQDIGKGATGSGGTLEISGSAAVFIKGNSSLTPITSTHTYKSDYVISESMAYGYDMPTGWEGLAYAYLRPYTVAVTKVGNGTQDPTGDQTVYHGTDLTIEATPDTGHHVALINSNKGHTVSQEGNTFTIEDVTDNDTVLITYMINTYEVTVIAGSNGTVSPNGVQFVTHGDDLVIDPEGNTGYNPSTVAPSMPCTIISNDDGTFTFSGIEDTGTLTVTFAINTYNITFDLRDYGMSDDDLLFTNITHGDPMPTAPTVTANNGYDFIGWSVDGSKANMQDLPSTVLKFDTFFAVYESKDIIMDTDNRLMGENRTGTAVDIARNGWDDADVVFIAAGWSFSDALASVPLAHQFDAPIFMANKDKDSLSDATIYAINELTPTTIYLLGGTAALTDNIRAQLAAEGYTDIQRIAGDNRQSTAVEIANALKVKVGTTKEAVIVNGWNYPDALGVAPAAAINGMPILFTRTDSIPDETVAALVNLGVEKIYIIGGTNAVSAAVQTQLETNYTVQRIQGNSRVDTCLEVQKEFFPESGSYTYVFVATAYNFADALTGGVLAAKTNSPIILIKNGQSVSAAVKSYVANTEYVEIIVFGGVVSLNDATVNSLK